MNGSIKRVLSFALIMGGLGLLTVVAHYTYQKPGGWLQALTARQAAPLAERSEPGAGGLLKELVEARIVTLDLATFRIGIDPNPPSVRKDDPAGRDPETARAAQDRSRALVARLLGSTDGTVVQAEMEKWNIAHGLAAIRDNRHAANRILAGSAVIDAHVVATEWTARYVSEDVFLSATARDIPPDHRTFGFIAFGRQPGFGDWLSVPVAMADPRVRFESVIPPVPEGQAGTPVLVDVVGAGDMRILVDGKPLDLIGSSQDGTVTAPLPAGGDVVATLYCDRRDVVPPACAALSPAALLGLETGPLLQGEARQRPGAEDEGEGGGGAPAAAAWRIAFPAAIRGRTLAIEVAPRKEVPASFRRFADAAFSDDFIDPEASAPDDVIRRFRYVGDTRLYVRCAEPAGVVSGGNKTCQIGWRGLPVDRGVLPASVEVYLADGTSVFTQNRTGDPVSLEKGFAYDVLPYVGLHRDDYGSLAWHLARTTVPEERQPGAPDTPPRRVPAASATAFLTIDPAMQAMTVDHVDRVLRADPALYKGVVDNPRAYLPAVFNGVRRVSLVIVDAGDDRDARTGSSPGDILALSYAPHATRGMNRWDIDALNAWYSGFSPFAPRAWANADARSMPGSTFKGITAMAAVRAAALNVAGAQRLIEGYRVDQPSELGALRAAITATSDRELAGLRLRFAQPLSSAFVEARRGAAGPVADGRGACPLVPGGARGAAQAGVCEALMRSSNMWMAGVALKLDGPRLVAASGPGGDEGRLALVATAGLLWTDRPYSLAPDITAAAPSAGGEAVAVCRNSRLCAEPFGFDFERSALPRTTLAISAYGQSVQATPVAMATAYAAIARNATTRARIAYRSDPAAKVPAPVPAPAVGPGAPIDSSAAYIRYVRHGLWNVVNDPSGTGFAGFSAVPELRRRIFGKSGTAITVDRGARDPVDDAEADLEPRTVKTVWFVGWIEPEAGTNQRRLAFACMITHAVGRLGVGGRLCAPVVASLLNSIEKGYVPAPATRDAEIALPPVLRTDQSGPVE